jgi:hypothetical protein
MKQQAESIVGAVRGFAEKSGWVLADYRVFVRTAQPDGIYVAIYTDRCGTLVCETMNRIQGEIDALFNKVGPNDPGRQAIVSLEAMADASEDKLLSFLGFSEDLR